MCSAPDRIWSTITKNDQHHHHQQSRADGYPSTAGHLTYASTVPPSTNDDWMAQYAQMVTDRVSQGWSCYLMTFMFHQLRGSPITKRHQAHDRIMRIYSTLVTRVHRKPRKASPDDLPVLIGFLDLPVSKRERFSTPMTRCNDGLHFHALVLLPPSSRMKESLVNHFEENDRLYTGRSRSVQRIHVVPVTTAYERVVDYLLKTIRRHRLTYDDAVLVLPRSRSEF